MFVTRSTLEAIAAQFDSAVCPEKVFGELTGPKTAKLVALKSLYRGLTRACHPDLALPGDRALATQVFQSLGIWEGIARLKIENGTYGDYQPYYASAPSYTPVELVVRGQSLKLTGLIGEGVFASVHAAEYDAPEYDEPAFEAPKYRQDTQRFVFVKYARHAADNDLLEREFRVLKTFQHPEPDPNAAAFFHTQTAYVPSPVTSFSLLDEKGAKHRANVLSVPEGRCYTVETLRRDHFPLGLEPRHVWWIFRRLLLTIWMSHWKGYVHGGITPDHVLIFPEAHGLVLLDWTCAARIEEEHVPALNPTFQAFCPPELLRKEVALPSTDLFMAAATALYMLGGDPARRWIPPEVPVALGEALLSCLDPLAARRPQDAELFHNAFGNLLGKRVYAPMLIP